MSSLFSRLRRKLFPKRGKQVAPRRVGAGWVAAAPMTPPPENVTQIEGVLLSKRLEQAAKDNNATDPLHFLEYLRQMRRGYDPKNDGPSKLMTLVDEINKFEREELARRKAAATREPLHTCQDCGETFDTTDDYDEHACEPHEPDCMGDCCDPVKVEEEKR